MPAFKSSRFQLTLIVLALILISALRVGWLQHNHFLGIARFPDEVNYYLAGAKLLQLQGWGYFSTERSLWNAPFSILWVYLFNSHILTLQLVNLSFIAIAAFLIWDLVRRLHSLKLAWLSLVLHCAYWPFTEFGGSILSEPATCLLITCVVYLIYFFPSGFQSGLVLGLATMFRPTTQLFPLFAAGLGLFYARFRKCFLLLTLGALIIIAPYSLRNWLKFDTASIATGTGAVLFLGNDLRSAGNEPVYYGLDFDTSRITKPNTHLDLAGDRRLQQVALEKIAVNPTAAAKLYVEKLLRLMFGSSRAIFYPQSALTDSSSTVAALLLQVMQIFVFTAFILTSFGKVNGVLLLARSLVFYFLFLHAALFAIPRMMLPAYPLAILASLEVFRSARRVLACSALTVLIAFWLAFQHKFWNPNIVDKGYVRGFTSLRTLTLSEAIGPKNRVYRLVPQIPTELSKNQVLLFNVSCTETSKLRLNWKPGRRASLKLELGQHYYRISLSRHKDWQGAMVPMEAKLFGSCTLSEGFILFD